MSAGRRPGMKPIDCSGMQKNERIGVLIFYNAPHRTDEMTLRYASEHGEKQDTRKEQTGLTTSMSSRRREHCMLMVRTKANARFEVKARANYLYKYPMKTG